MRVRSNTMEREIMRERKNSRMEKVSLLSRVSSVLYSRIRGILDHSRM